MVAALFGCLLGEGRQGLASLFGAVLSQYVLMLLGSCCWPVVSSMNVICVKPTHRLCCARPSGLQSIRTTCQLFALYQSALDTTVPCEHFHVLLQPSPQIKISFFAEVQEYVAMKPKALATGENRRMREKVCKRSEVCWPFFGFGGGID